MKGSLPKGVNLTEIASFAENSCPSCGSTGMSVFYEIKDVPVHSVLLMPSREVALNYPKGDIALGFCQACGFILNLAFNPELHEYSSQYEETQGFSSTFQAFHHGLARYLIKRYDLRRKNIIEIGCGKGEFITMLCELGRNNGIGFDPAYMSGRNQSDTKGRVTFIKDFYSEKYSDYRGDFVCCKMTLEHIQNTAEFVSAVRRSVGDRTDTIVFFQVPDATRILREIAFWDIYYEHCSYFSLGSLARLFRRCGFNVIDLWKGYQDQYLMIEAKPGNGGGIPRLGQEESTEEAARDVTYFSKNYKHKLDFWRRELEPIRQSGKHIVLWGAGSKGVAFLTTLGIRDEIEYAVDINPYKHGTYMAGTGQEIVAPDFLRKYKPDTVIVMNPVYCDEVRGHLDRMDLAPEIIAV